MATEHVNEFTMDTLREAVCRMPKEKLTTGYVVNSKVAQRIRSELELAPTVELLFAGVAVFEKEDQIGDAYAFHNREAMIKYLKGEIDELAVMLQTTNLNE